MLYTELFGLKDKVALVIGGAGGIGQEISKIYAEFGADVVIASRKPEAGAEVKAYIESLGRKCLLYKVDVLDEAAVENMVSNIVSELGAIDILLNAAGTNIWQKAQEYSVENWDKVMDLNVKGTFIACREVGKQMIKQQGGKIINISSVRSFLGYPENYTAYCASKGAVNMYTKCLAAEWAKFNINVNAVAPTFIETPLVADMLSDEKTKQSLINRIPLGRLGKPADLVGTVLYFSSKASDFITGQILFADGGVTCVQ
jgi:gluconate 5-dehydrogenase